MHGAEHTDLVHVRSSWPAVIKQNESEEVAACQSNSTRAKRDLLNTDHHKNYPVKTTD